MKHEALTVVKEKKKVNLTTWDKKHKEDSQRDNTREGNMQTEKKKKARECSNKKAYLTGRRRRDTHNTKDTRNTLKKEPKPLTYFFEKECLQDTKCCTRKRKGKLLITQNKNTTTEQSASTASPYQVSRRLKEHRKRKQKPLTEAILRSTLWRNGECERSHEHRRTTIYIQD